MKYIAQQLSAHLIIALFGINLRIACAVRKYHSGSICAGATSGVTG